MSDYPISGQCDERFSAVREAFIKNYDDGLELGSAFTLIIDDELLVDLRGGFSDREKIKPWAEDTIVPVASSSKIIINMSGLWAIDNGFIDLDEPIATYWPEFGQNGKSKIPVRNIFSHSTGLAHLDDKPGFDVLDDWDEVVKRIELQEPWWEPGTQSGYTPYIYGHLVGALLKRATGRTLHEIYKEELGEPFGLDFSFGLTDSIASRNAEIALADGGPMDGVEIDPNSVSYRAIGYTFVEHANNAYFIEKGGTKGMNIPASNGVTNARALTRAGSILAQGGKAMGKRFISEQSAALPYEEQIYTEDLCMMNTPVRWGLGFAINSKEIPFPWPNAFHWGGNGGSYCVMVPELKMTWAYTPNKHVQGPRTLDPRGGFMQDAVIKCLEKDWP